MNYLEIIQKDLPSILLSIRKEIMEDETIFEFIDNKKELNKLLDLQENLINKYLNDFQLENLDENSCQQFYKDLRIPYTIIYRSLNLLKSEILKSLNNENIEKTTIYNFSLYFQKFTDIIAKVYLKKDIYALKQLINSPFNKYLLFHAHIDWINKIIKSIVEDNINYFPLIGAKNCEFNNYLYYPESLMVCIDKNLCIYLDDLHKLIHKTANSFYLFYSKKKFSESYFLFKDLKEQILKFSKLISELYFVTYSDLEHSFFKLTSLLQETETLYLTMINIKSVKNLNNIYGEHTITLALQQLSKKLHHLIKDEQDKTLLINGVTSNFYLLNMKYSKESYINLINKIKKLIAKPIKIDNTFINLESIIVGIKIKKYSEFTEYELVKMLNFIKNKAKKENKNLCYYINNQDLKIVEEILNERYNEKFILEKIENKQIDVMFQPIYDVNNGELYTIEALGRIIDDDKLLPAGIFIDKIYEMNMIEKFDMLILEQLIKKEHFIKTITKKIFINISFQSLLNKEYMEKLQLLFDSFKIDVILELTEQKFIENISLLEEIHKKYNVYFAVDDFGSGYSSLKSVVELVKKGVLKILKIDGTLIQNIENDKYMKKIVKIISTLGQELNLKTVAEYVENQKILEMMSVLSIDLAQGYHLSKPKTIEELIVQNME